MAALPAPLTDAADRAEFRRARHREGVELYRAHIVRHAFEPHSHDAFGLGVVEQGVERFRYRGGEHLAGSGALVTMNPALLHTGRAETAAGWHYRMLYVDEATLAQVSGEPGWSFGDAVTVDQARARRVAALLRALWGLARDGAEPLAFDSLLAQVIDELRPLAVGNRAAPRSAGAPRFDRVVQALRAGLDRRWMLAELAAIEDLSPWHFLRAFRDAHDATPQQMLMALRLLDAKRRLAAGEAPAAVAAAVGLADQAHLTRAFVRRYGVTPGRYRQQATS